LGFDEIDGEGVHLLADALLFLAVVELLLLEVIEVVLLDLEELLLLQLQSQGWFELRTRRDNLEAFNAPLLLTSSSSSSRGLPGDSSLLEFRKVEAPLAIRTEIIAKQVGIEGRRHDHKFDPLPVLAIDDLLQRHEGEVHVQAALVYLVEDDVRVGDRLHEEQLLDEDSVGHVDNAAVLLPEALHADVVAHPRTQLALQFLGHSHGKTSGGDSSWLADDDLRFGMFPQDVLGNLR
jgi:hypothetical protein